MRLPDSTLASNMSPYEACVVLEPPHDGLQLPTDGIVALCWTHTAVLAGRAHCFWDVGHSLSAPHCSRPAHCTHDRRFQCGHVMPNKSCCYPMKNNIHNDIATSWWKGGTVREDPCSGRPTKCAEYGRSSQCYCDRILSLSSYSTCH